MQKLGNWRVQICGYTRQGLKVIPCCLLQTTKLEMNVSTGNLFTILKNNNDLHVTTRGRVATHKNHSQING